MLVERTRTGVQLTQKGAQIAERAARVLGDVRDLVAYAQHTSKILSGPLRLGVIPSIAPYMLPPLLPMLKESYRELVLHVRETQTRVLVEELLEGKIDVVLLALPIKHPDIEQLPLFEDKFLLALPKDRKVSGRVRATKEMVEKDRLLLLEEGHCLRDQALAYCTLKQVDSISTFGASSLSTIVEMVAGGLGITLLPEMCLEIEGRGRDLSLVRFTEPEPSRSVGLIWRSTSPRKDDFIEFGKYVKRAWDAGPARAAHAALKGK
jgi:LysR family hydrogen peroxide-inducible transcriptional activator